MNQNSIDVYYQENFNLAKTFCIKSKDSANAVNNWITLQYGIDAVDVVDLTTWKYYLNVCGEYHSSDTVMYVTSLDNLQTIEFNAINLQTNTATAAEYQYGTRYYYSLLNQYPNQEQLILGILYPANMENSVNSPEGTILSYPRNLILPQEITLISELQIWIYDYLARWNVRAFADSDSLYQIAYLSVMYLNLVIKIINLRVKRCHTSEAHDFHITQFLASHYGLDKYINDMTLNQILFLYRNIRYIERHTGFTSTFKTLIEELLTSRNIPLSAFTAKLTSNFNADYTSELSFDTKALNALVNIENKTKYDYSDFMTKLTSLAPDNAVVIQNKYNEIQRTLQNSPAAIMVTKELESSMYDYTDAVPHQFTNILLNEWIYLSSIGQYSAIINFTDPATATPYTLSAEDAFIYMTYLFFKSVNITPLVVPTAMAIKVRKLILPTVSEMTNLCESNYQMATQMANFFLSIQPTDFLTESITSFYSLCTSIFESGIQEWYKTSLEQNSYYRAQLHNMLDYMYVDVNVNFTSSGQSFVSWLSERALPDPTYSLLEFQELITVISNTATGLSLVNTQPFAVIQKAMLNILTTLSSYSIQTIAEINTTPMILLNWATLRVGNEYFSVNNEQYVREDIDVVSYKSSMSNTLEFISNAPIPKSAIIDNTVNKYKINISSEYFYNQLYEDTRIITTSQFIITNSGLNTFGFSNYETLTTVQANTLPDIWQNNLI